MTEPVEVRNERVVTGQPGSPRTVSSRSAIVPVGYKARQLVWLSVAVVDLFLILRFALLAVGAGDSGFTSVVYRVASALAWPFKGVLGVTQASGHPLQWVNILAIVVYTAAAWIVSRLVSIASAPPKGAPAF